MKLIWCWRCKMEIPMLDEAEFAIVKNLYSAAFATEGVSIDERFQPVCDAYNSLTGMAETNANAIMHHRISNFGPPCNWCGKPLRTPQASFCAACGKTSEAQLVR